MRLAQAQVVVHLQVGEHGKIIPPPQTDLHTLSPGLCSITNRIKNGTALSHSPALILFSSFTHDLIDLDQISACIV